MNILILHSSSDLYGSGKIILLSTLAFAKKGHAVLVVLSEDGPLANEFRKRNIDVKIIRLGVLRRKYMSLRGIINRVYILMKAFLQLRKLSRQREINVIYSNTTATIVGAFVAKSLKIPHFWHIHEIIMHPAFMTNTIGFLLKHFSSKIVVVSQAVYNHWSKYDVIKKMELIHNGIDIKPFINKKSFLKEELGLGKETVLIGMIGRINYMKGQKYFLELAKEISLRHSFIRFVMVGDAYPGYEHLYNELAIIKRTAGIEQVVYDLGYREDIPNIVAGLDMLVLPSIEPDSFPTVILEAMAAAKPVIATTQGGAMEMISPGETGLLIPINDPRSAIVEMEPLLIDEKLRKKMGQRGHERLITHFSLETFNQKIGDIIE